jgi:two-component system, OmpR family, phosphate regulon sensor histidine kinase PhoR
MRIRAPANVQLVRAQVVLILGALIPTILTTPIGIILLVSGEPGWIEIIAGVLVLAFATSSVTGFILGGIFLRRGSALVSVQHDFLSSVSHELRTPMTSMRMFVEALLNDRLTDPTERARCLRALGQEVDRLDGLVGKLIQLSRIESDRDPYERVTIRVEDVFVDARAAFETIQTLDKTILTADVEDELLVVGDRSALVQVLVNLLSNAWKYSGANKEIHCTAKATSDKEIEIVVQDNGPGIPGHEQKNVFDKFWRGQDAVESGTQGSGLGLAIVHGIVKVHRGRIELHSPSGGGTAFHVHLPRGKPE